MAVIEGIWVTPQYVNGPKQPGGNFGSIKTADYGYISVPVDQLHHFQPRKRVCINIEERGEYKNFKGFTGHQGATPPAQNAGAVWDGRQLPQRAPRPAPRRAPPPRQQELPFDIDAMRIFVTGVTGRAIGSGHFQAQDIDELVKEAKAAYLKHMTNADSPAPMGDLNEPLPDPDSYGAAPPDDEIPY